MTKIEELREGIILSVAASYCGTIPTWDDAIKKAIEEVDSLIAAAREEGAEQESRRWLGEIERAVKEGTLGGFVSDALDNASVLAPARKEKP